jgi:acetyl-CoA synthetase
MLTVVWLCCLLLSVQVRVLYTAPTLIRSLMQHGDHYVTQHDRSSLRILGTVGEPINPHAWDWYHQVGPYGHVSGV